MSKDADFQNPPLAFMTALGRVESGQAQIWVRTAHPGRFIVQWWPEDEGINRRRRTLEVCAGNERDNTACIELPGTGRPALTPLTRYQYRLIDSSEKNVLGGGSFETAPADDSSTPGRFSIAIMSCNQPFDARGRIRPASGRMLKAARQCLDRHNTKFILLLGDQMYSDFPEKLSLFNPEYFALAAPAGKETIHECSSDEIRRLFQRRYRHFWNQPDWQAMQAERPCYPILDDHDIVDNWGSREKDQTDKWRRIGEGARMAYFDYQGCRLWPAESPLPPSFHTNFTYGNTATFIMDLRSNRRAGENGRLYEPQQEADLEKFLRENSEKKAMFIVVSVPVVHLPRFLARMIARLPHTGEDFSDRWSSGAHIRDRDRLLYLLHAHQQNNPTQKLVLLSGDIHIGCVHEIAWQDSARSMYQFVSSPITHTTPLPIQLGSKALIRMNNKFSTMDGRHEARVKLLKASGEQRQNPYSGLNLGLIEIETPEPDADPKLRFLLYGHEEEEPICVFRSEQI